MPNDPEQFIEQMIKAAKQRQDLSAWQHHRDRETSDLANLILDLSSLPRHQIEMPDLAKIQGRVLDRISVPQSEHRGIWASIPSFLKIGSAVFGSLLIVVSLTMGVAVAALQSGPDSAIYPLKKIVENIELRLTPEQEVASRQMQFAITRVEEIQAVIEQQQQGQLSNQEAKQIISATVKDLQKSTSAAARNTKAQPRSAIVNKLADINNKLKIASINSEGEVRIEIEKALQSTQDSQAEAIKNFEESGVKIANPPSDNNITASGKLTQVTESTVNIGTAKFLLTKETKYVNLSAADLKAGLVVDIIGQIKDNKSYADQITLIEPKVSGESTVRTEIINPEIVPLDPNSTTETQTAH